MVDEEADSNPTRDIEELERLLAKDPQSHFTKIQVHSVITKIEPFIHTQPMSPLYGIFESYKSSTKPYKVDRKMKSPSRVSLQGNVIRGLQDSFYVKPSRDFNRPLRPPSGLKGLLHTLNATVIPTKFFLQPYKLMHVSGAWLILGCKETFHARLVGCYTEYDEAVVSCGKERGFLSQKGSGVGRGVKEKDLNVANRKTVKDGVIPPIIVGLNLIALNFEKDTILDGNTPGNLGSFPPLPTQATTSAGNAPGKSSYANVTGKPSGKKLNIHTLFTPGGNRIDVVVLVESIRAISDRFANTAYGFFLGKRVAYPVVANYGLDTMLENGPWFIRNNLLILKKWHPNENLLKEDVSTVPVWVKLQGVPVTAFSDDGLSAIATKLGTGEKKTAKKTSRTSRGVSVGSKIGFKPQKEHRHVSKKLTASSSGNKRKGVEPTIDVSNSNPFEVLNSVDNVVELGTNANLKFEEFLTSGQVILMDNVGNPLKKVEFLDDYDSEDEVASVDNDMARSLASERLELLWIFVQEKMSRDVLTVGSTMRIPLLYRGEYSKWVERFMNYLEEKMDGEAMINSIKNGDQPLPRVTQVSIAGTSSIEQPHLKDKSMWKDAVLYEYETFKATEGELLLDTYIRYLKVINDLKKCGYSKDNCELNFNILKQNQGDVNDAMGLKKKTVVVTSDPLALIVEKTKVSKRKEKVVVSSDSKGSDADGFSELKKITALLAKDFNRRKFYSKLTNNNLRTSSTSQSANKKQEFVKMNDKKIEKKDDEKKRDMSKVKCYNCKKEGHFTKDCKKVKVKDYEYYKTKMLLAKKDKDEQVLLAEDQAWMESSSDSDQEINANMVFMAQIEKVLSDSETSSSYVDDKISEIADQEVLYDKMNVQLVELDKHVRDLKNTVLEKDFKISELEEVVRNKDLEIEKCLERLNVCENKLHKMGQTNQTVHMIMPSKDTLYNGRKGIVIDGYGDVVIGSMTIKKVYYVEGLGYNLFSVGQFCDKGLKVAFQKSTCFVRNEDGVDLLTGDHSSNLYTIALNEVASNSSTCLLAKASSSQYWLWHQRLSHLNFATINNLMKNNLVQCLPKMKFEKSSFMFRVRTREDSSKTSQVQNSFYFNQATLSSSHGFVWRCALKAEAITTACFTQNHLIIHKHFDKTPYELMNKRKPNIKFFRVFGCRCYLFNDYKDVGKLKAKGDIGVFVGYSKESTAFRIYNKRTRKIHESVNVNFDEILEMASKQFSLEPGLSNLNETRKSLNLVVSQVSETSEKDLEDLFQKIYDESFHESSESFQEGSSSSSLNDDVHQSLEEVMVPSSNTQSISNNMIPNVDESSTSHNVFNKRLEDAYFDASTSFHDPSNVHTFYQPYPHEKKWTKDCKIHVKYRSFHSIRAESPYDTKWAKMAQGKNGLHQSHSKAGPPYGGDIGVFVGYSKESVAFRIYNKRTRKIHESVNVNFDEILEMASKQFSLEPGLSKLNETRKSSNPLVSKVDEASKKDLEDLFQDFYDEYFDSSKIMKSSTTNVETSINEEVFHEVFESLQRESSSSSLNDDVQQTSTSHNVFNERLEDAYFDASTSFHDLSNVHTYYQPYPHEKKWTKDHPLYKIIGDPKSSVRTRGQLENSCLFSCLLSFIEPANVAKALRDADWVNAIQEELDQFARLKVWRLVPRPEGKSMIKTKWIFKNKKDESSLDFTVFQMDVKTSFLNRILKEEVMENCDTVPTPMVEQAKLKLDLVGKPVDHTDYRSMIGSLMYDTSSRPYIMFATCMCARYQANPNEHHVLAVKRIFHYHKGTINLGLWYPKDSGFDLTTYSDADHAGCHLDRKSTSGSVQFLGDKLVCWSSKKQNCVSISTAESEYVAGLCCGAQVLWMRTQLTDYGFFYDKVPIYCDSKSAIAISCNPVQHTRTKHIDVRYHFIKDHVEKGTKELYFVGTEYQLADSFTKSLPEARFKFLVEKLSMMSRET
nr:retrovirus-related Pol polyprotein from transposon TNT 1-94 [Tanacetum cinerariifolium]